MLQLPESKVFTHLKQAQDFRASVKRLGCRVGLEQFGTGLNSYQLMGRTAAPPPREKEKDKTKA